MDCQEAVRIVDIVEYQDDNLGFRVQGKAGRREGSFMEKRAWKSEARENL